MNLTAIVVAGGAGRRFGGPKQFRAVGGRPMVEWSLGLFQEAGDVTGTVLVVPEADVADASALLARFNKLAAVVPGGAERRESVAAGIAALGEGVSHVLVHDAARPLATAALVARVAEALRTWDAVVPALAAADTLKRVGADRIVMETVDRTEIVQVQTPQGFRRSLLERAHAEVRGGAATDDASMVEALGEPVHAVEGESDNFKVTTPADLDRADLLLGARAGAGVRLRVGHGYDVHRLVEGRRLVLGGVEIPHALGLLGHSDADVLLHAIGDAMLGAAGARDLGVHFPDTDPRWAGADSRALLRRVREIAAERGWRPENVDATVIAQRPRLAPHIPRMIANVAECLGIAPDQVNVKATTTETLGFAGREEGIAAHAVCTLIGRGPRP